MNKLRNRHTGRVNAYKQNVINRGKLVQDPQGRRYYRLALPNRFVARDEEGTVLRDEDGNVQYYFKDSRSQIVRDPADV